MPPVIHWPVSQPPRAIVTGRNTSTSTRPAAKASLASVADRIIAVRAAAETNGDRTRARRSAMMIRGPWARYAPARNRLRDPDPRHGRLPGQREPGEAQGDGEQIRRNPRAQEPSPLWALVSR